MRISPAVPGARILGLGEYQPATVVTNADLAARMDTSDEWIRTRVGIRSRRIAGPTESVADMAVIAGGKALAAAGLDPTDVDLVIVATCTMPSPIPHAAAQVAARLGIPAPGAYDLNAACAGFVYGLTAAASAVTSGAANRVLLVGAEKLSDWVDRDDRSTAIIFADGAGAAVVGPAATEDEVGIGPVVWGSTGEQVDLIRIADRNSYLWQEGQAVFRWATTALAPVAVEACRRAGIAPTDLAAFVPHQANLRIIEAIARRLGAAGVPVADDIVDAGNTSSASIPLALARMAARGDVRPGDPVLLLGFGAGLTYAGQVVLCP
ncbi:MAG: 3-oxoacyl-[acyl-carrier-protein] synthase, KASIII [uncultured Corynebacteriales bacterium]|uniref:Beta-ketoacyl-[acyl-carrier-protein] synthase III n=1 Tax=uncultured Mycobacteriales bacterium TaxID=581187 RepID=A0A6J4IJ43_9ACTN|nr:MAG: 3-oxoacyl-[acyl-carrier-protein] synthase, KASIII [uncultured Corynebacteriales bacterium]